MRKAFGWIFSWGLYWIGDAVSRPMRLDLPEIVLDGLYPVYSFFMRNSLRAQDWGGAGPWMDSQGE